MSLSTMLEHDALEEAAVSESVKVQPESAVRVAVPDELELLAAVEAAELALALEEDFLTLVLTEPVAIGMLPVPNGTPVPSGMLAVEPKVLKAFTWSAWWFSWRSTLHQGAG